jgi:pimeloyl-ACP methyl ester carboxylesterase
MPDNVPQRAGVRLRTYSLWTGAAISIAVCSIYQPTSAQEALDLSYGRGETRTATVNGTELTYIERGTGTPVVLVHGQLSDYRFWKAIIEAASARHRVVAYSRRYFFPNPSSESLPRFGGPTDVPDLIAFIEALGISPVHLVGHSSGGHAALLVAIERPDLVQSLVLAEGGFLPGPGTENGVAASRTARTLLEADKDEEAVRTFIDTTSGPGSFDRMTQVERQANLDNRMALGLPISPSPSCEEVGSVAMPTLIVRGDSSPTFLHSMMDALAACLPSAEQAMIPNASHAMFVDNPAAFNAVLLPFLDANDP